MYDVKWNNMISVNKNGFKSAGVNEYKDVDLDLFQVLLFEDFWTFKIEKFYEKNFQKFLLKKKQNLCSGMCLASSRRKRRSLTGQRIRRKILRLHLASSTGRALFMDQFVC